MYEEVIEQLLDYCECIKDLGKDPAELERNVAELIQLISIQTCWAQSPCETFLNSERTEYMEVGDICKCSCDGTVVEFLPFYYPFNPLSFKVELIRLEGIKEEVTGIAEEDFAFITSLGILRIDLRDYVEGQNKCSCKVDFRLRITYDAGFELIPDCLLKLFCDLLGVIYRKNTCTCGHCAACNAGNDDDVPAIYTEEDTISPTIDDYLDRVILDSYRDQLALISLCGRSRKDYNWLGVVV